MESFTISLDIKEKECDVSGSIVGLEFIYQQQNIAEKFIQFCSGKLKYLKIKGSARVMLFNTTFNNISTISWQSVLLVEETLHKKNCM